MRKKVIIVDDDLLSTVLQKSYIIKSGVDQSPVCFTHGWDALEYLNQNSNISFIMILDIHIPELNAWDYLEILAQKKIKNAEILIVSSSISIHDQQKSENYPFVIGCREKPVSIEDCLILFK